MKKLNDVMKVLRGPEGCPWDKKQTMESLTSCLLEETYEVIDAIMTDSGEKVQEELGDLLCIVSMLIVIGEEKEKFTKQKVIGGAVKKMRRRHPHVFSSGSAKTAESAHTLWHKAKEREKGVKKRKSVLDDLSSKQPALLKSDKIQRRVARVRFDWPSIEGVIDKVEEELEELKVEIRKKRKNEKKIQEELGDVLFSVVNIGRKKEIAAV